MRASTTLGERRFSYEKEKMSEMSKKKKKMSEMSKKIMKKICLISFICQLHTMFPADRADCYEWLMRRK